MANNEIDTTQNVGKLTTISTTMRMWRGSAGASPDEAQPGLHSKPMDAAIGRVLASHHRVGRHGRRFWSKTQNTNKKLFLAS